MIEPICPIIIVFSVTQISTKPRHSHLELAELVPALVGGDDGVREEVVVDLDNVGPGDDLPDL